jgi:hypothetical protein
MERANLSKRQAGRRTTGPDCHYPPGTSKWNKIEQIAACDVDHEVTCGALKFQAQQGGRKTLRLHIRRATHTRMPTNNMVV